MTSPREPNRKQTAYRRGSCHPARATVEKYNTKNVNPGTSDENPTTMGQASGIMKSSGESTLSNAQERSTSDNAQETVQGTSQGTTQTHSGVKKSADQRLPGAQRSSGTQHNSGNQPNLPISVFPENTFCAGAKHSVCCSGKTHPDLHPRMPRMPRRFEQPIFRLDSALRKRTTNCLPLSSPRNAFSLAQ